MWRFAHFEANIRPPAANKKEGMRHDLCHWPPLGAEAVVNDIYKATPW
jgi:hypothetical protein